METAIVAIAGPSGSGKSTLATHIQLEAAKQYGDDIAVLRLGLADSLRDVLAGICGEYEPVIKCKDQAAKLVDVYGRTVREHLIGLGAYLEEYHPEFVMARAQAIIRDFLLGVDGTRALVIVDDVRRVKELRDLHYLVGDALCQYAGEFLVVHTDSDNEDVVFEKEVTSWEHNKALRYGRVSRLEYGKPKKNGFKQAREMAAQVVNTIFKE